jgi:TonB family protein
MHVDEVRARIVALTSLRVEHRRPDAPTGERPANALTETELRAAHGRVPIVLREVKPKYSESALERHVEGTVVLEAVVLPDGWVDGIRVVQSLDPGLDKAAVTALEGWQFAPATMADQPVPAIVTCELTFTLR